MKCPSCDTTNCEEKEVEESFTYNSRRYILVVPTMVCSCCDLMWMDDRSMEVRTKTIMEGKLRGETIQ